MKIAIAGYGAEGKSNYQYFAGRGEVTIVDERLEIPDLPAGVPTLLGPGVFERLEDFDLVVRTAGLNPNKIRTSGKVWSATNEFFAACRTDIIGVTGTKGKGTTASLIESILRAAGKKTVLVGNIGRPALDALDEANQADVVIYELSSFQLWDLEKSPLVAVVLMIETDHLDVHADMAEYVAAKANIRRYQGQDGICFYHPTNPYSRQIAETDEWAEDEHEHKEFLAQAIRYNDPAEKRSVYVQGGNFWVDNQPICPLEALQLPGAHNAENACAAISAARQYTVDNAAIEAGLRAFKGLDHRLKLVGEHGGVRYYDDSIATTPGSAMAAIRAFSEPKVLILGGSDKGADYTELVKLCKNTGTCVVAIGQTGSQIAELCRQHGTPVREVGRAPMGEIVAAASSLALPGGVVILSPASASFDMFTSYGDRGNQFIAAVNQLTQEGK